MKILLIEDSDLLGPILERSLKSKGHEVRWVTTLGHAFTAYLATPDLIITDRELPDGDGWEWAEKRESNTPVIYMSGNPLTLQGKENKFYHKGVHPIGRLWDLVKNASG